MRSLSFVKRNDSHDWKVVLLNLRTNEKKTYPAHVCEARDLEGHEEHTSIKEEEVALPEAGVVVCFKVHGLRNWPDSCSSHYY